MKIWSVLLSLILFLGLTFFPFEVVAQSRRGSTRTPAITPSPSPSPTPGPVDSYDLFWPIAAGKVMGDPMYFLKSLKETLREVLVFGDYKKSEYNITLSEKRLLEAEQLILVKNDLENAKLTVNVAKSKMQKAIESAEKAKDSPDIATLKTKLALSADKQRKLTNYIMTQMDKGDTQELEAYEDLLSSILSNPQ